MREKAQGNLNTPPHRPPHELVDEPVTEGLPVDNFSRVVEDVLSCRIDWPAVTLLDALAVNGVGLSAARVIRSLGGCRKASVQEKNTGNPSAPPWRSPWKREIWQRSRAMGHALSPCPPPHFQTHLFLIVVKPGTAGGCAVVIPVACWHMVRIRVVLCEALAARIRCV